MDKLGCRLYAFREEEKAPCLHHCYTYQLGTFLLNSLSNFPLALILGSRCQS